MSIKLEKINRYNWEEAIDLEVSEDHRNHVTSNEYSIAEAQFYSGIDAYAIYNDDKMIGFTLFGAAIDDDNDEEEIVYPGSLFWIWRFMIAEGERFKGYGKEAMRIVIEKARQAGYKIVYLSTDPDNAKGIRFYRGLGFKSTGVTQYEEEVFELILN